eukprot:6176395-Pleurochrysis_carterae.AAC.1
MAPCLPRQSARPPCASHKCGSLRAWAEAGTIDGGGDDVARAGGVEAGGDTSRGGDEKTCDGGSTGDGAAGGDGTDGGEGHSGRSAVHSIHCWKKSTR